MNILDSITVFTKTGVVVFHYSFRDHLNDPLVPVAADQNPHLVSKLSLQRINTFISTILLDPLTSSNTKSRKRCILPASSSDSVSMVVEWLESTKNIQSKLPSSGGVNSDDLIALVMYPNLVLSSVSTYESTQSLNGEGISGSVRGLIPWLPKFLQYLLREYTLFYNSVSPTRSVPFKQTLFDATLMVLLKKVQGEAHDLLNINEEEVTEENTGGNDHSDQNKSMSSNDQLKLDGRGETRIHHHGKKGKKEATVWHDSLQKVTKETMAALDRSKDSNPNLSGIDAVVAEDSRALAEARAVYLPSDGETPLWEENDELSDASDASMGQSKTWGMALKGLFDQVSGNKILSLQDLDGPLDEMQKLLTSKNVSSEIATTICETVKTQLVGKRMASFSRVKTAVRMALEDSIEKILKPTRTRDIDLLRAVVSKREQQRNSFFQTQKQLKLPFVIVMVGINGVGKSTSLAKIAYYLKCNGCSPLIAACDTFRSGAVEQLNVHAKCLDVPLFQMGYAKDPAVVAKAAINHASSNNHDVVLVDTAGRMQNNVPLMLALSKLVVESNPDLVLFVCEALVGNDGMDQLKLFDRALKSAGHKRQIDGIVLTKFDTVSDKVGATLTLTHTTGAPVVFVGIGQKYHHLKKLSANAVIQSLFS